MRCAAIALIQCMLKKLLRVGQHLIVREALSLTVAKNRRKRSILQRHSAKFLCCGFEDVFRVISAQERGQAFRVLFLIVWSWSLEERHLLQLPAYLNEVQVAALQFSLVLEAE